MLNDEGERNRVGERNTNGSLYSATMRRRWVRMSGEMEAKKVDTLFLDRSRQRQGKGRLGCAAAAGGRSGESDDEVRDAPCVAD